MTCASGSQTPLSLPELVASNTDSGSSQDSDRPCCGFRNAIFTGVAELIIPPPPKPLLNPHHTFYYKGLVCKKVIIYCCYYLPWAIHLLSSQDKVLLLLLLLFFPSVLVCVCVYADCLRVFPTHNIPPDQIRSVFVQSPSFFFFFCVNLRGHRLCLSVKDRKAENDSKWRPNPFGHIEESTKESTKIS